jgi:hypothetical protein
MHTDLEEEIMKKCLLCIIIVDLSVVLLAACNLPVRQLDSAPPPTPLPATNTSEPPPPPSTDTPEPEPTIDPYADITHTDFPSDPVLTYWAYDCQTGKYTQVLDKPNIGGGCDSWETNFIERPVTDAGNLFHPHLDIVRFQMGKDETWLYADILTAGWEGAQVTLSGTYALEMDFDMDGQGEILLVVDNPSRFSAGEWHTLGVQVWEDTNNDIGGDTLVYADDENPGDGYETQLFDQGLGDDPDLAWARISPDDPLTVEFAIKLTAIPVTGAFLWWTWASQLPLDPALFDYVDTYDDSEIFEIGNSCRWVFEGPPQPVKNICFYEAPTPEPNTEYCWVRPTGIFTHLPEAVCRACPVPCPSDSVCFGSCTP